MTFEVVLIPGARLEDSLRDLPPTWEVRPIGSLARVLTSTVDKLSTEGEIPVLLCNYTDVYYRDVIDDSSGFMRSTATPAQVKRYSVLAGDVVITKESETSDDIGRPAYVSASLPGVVYGYHLAIYRPVDKRFSRFIRYLFESNYVRTSLEIRTPGVTRVGLSQNTLKYLRVPSPDPETAQRVADFLDRETAEIDAFIRDQEELIGLLHERQRAAVAHEFEPILDVSGQSFRPAPLSVALRERDQRALSEQLPMYSVSIHKGVVPWAEINDGEPSADSFTHYKRIDKDDLVLNRMRAFQGSSGLAPGRGMVSPDYAVFSVKAAAHPPFLQLLMKSQPMVEAMKQRLRGIGDQDSGAIRTPRINARDLLRIRVDLPNRVEQEAITERVQRAARETESLLSDARSAVELSRERRSALISAAVTGKIDVREHVGV